MRNFAKLMMLGVAVMGLSSQAKAMSNHCQQLVNAGARQIMQEAPSGASITMNQARALAYQAIENEEIQTKNPICKRDASAKARHAELPSSAAWRAMSCNQATTWAIKYMSQTSATFKSWPRQRQVAVVRQNFSLNKNYNPCASCASQD